MEKRGGKGRGRDIEIREEEERRIILKRQEERKEGFWRERREGIGKERRILRRKGIKGDIKRTEEKR